MTITYMSTVNCRNVDETGSMWPICLCALCSMVRRCDHRQRV